MGWMTVMAAAALMAAPADEPIEVWMGHVHPDTLVREDLAWDEVRAGLDVIQLAINAVAYLMPEADQRALLGMAKDAGIKVGIECGYFDWEPTLEDFTADPNPKGISEQVRKALAPGIGAETARIEMRKLAHVIDGYGPPDYLVLDGPVRRLIHPGADLGRTTPHGEEQGLDGIDAAVDEVIAYMRTWRAQYPAVQFIFLTNFPNWGWKGEMAYWASGPEAMFWGDYAPVVRALLEKSAAAGLPPASVRADNPYDYFTATAEVPSPPWPPALKDRTTVDWPARLLELERTVADAGVAFDLIINSGQAGHTSDEAVYEASLAYLDRYRAMGGAARRYVFQTWYPHPKEMGPETEPYTMTYLLREAIRRVKGAVEG